MKLLCPMVKEKKHLQKNTLYDQGHTKCCLVPSKSYDLCTCKVWSCYVQQFRRRCIYKKVHYLKVTLNVAQCPLHHVTYAPTEFEVTTSKALEGEAFTRKFNIWPLTLGSRSHKMLPSTLYIMWPIQLQSLKLLGLTLKEEIQLQENTLFDLWPGPLDQGHTKCSP